MVYAVFRPVATVQLPLEVAKLLEQCHFTHTCIARLVKNLQYFLKSLRSLSVIASARQDQFVHNIWRAMSRYKMFCK